MVDVDAAPGEMGRLPVGQDLHVAGEDHQLGIGFVRDPAHFGFLFGLGRGGHRQVVEGNVADIGVADRLARVVGDDRHRLDRQFADAPAIEQVGQAVIEPADHDQHAARPVAPHQLPAHRASFGKGGEGSAEGLGVAGPGIEGDPHEEGIARPVVELLRLQDIGAAFEQQAGDLRGNARPVGAAQGQDQRLGHVSGAPAPLRTRPSAW